MRRGMRKKYQTEERLNSYLKMKGITIDELKTNFKKRVYMDEYLKIKGISDPEIPEKNIRDFYDDNLSEKTPAGITPYENVRGFIKKFLQEGETDKKLAAHTEELKKKATIEVFLD